MQKPVCRLWWNVLNMFCYVKSIKKQATPVVCLTIFMNSIVHVDFAYLMFLFFIVVKPREVRSCTKSVAHATDVVAPRKAKGRFPSPPIGFSSCRIHNLTYWVMSCLEACVPLCVKCVPVVLVWEILSVSEQTVEVVACCCCWELLLLATSCLLPWVVNFPESVWTVDMK